MSDLRPTAAARLIRLPRRAVAMLLALYKATISPLLPRACRFHPTCSEYFREAVLTHGVLRGTRLGVWRLLRCQPFSRGGFDPVPPARSGRPAPGSGRPAPAEDAG